MHCRSHLLLLLKCRHALVASSPLLLNNHICRPVYTMQQWLMLMVLFMPLLSTRLISIHMCIMLGHGMIL